MKNYLIIILLLFIPLAFAAEIEKFELKNLHGSWEGVGEFLIPIANTTMEISGKADFVYDEKKQRLRTSLVGEKFFFKYSDSGYLWIDNATDTISWEVWDNRGKHALYHGKVEGNAVTGSRYRGKDLYEVMIKQVTLDSIDFKLTITQPDGDKIDKAFFHLWRVK
jgi:hypothetical protein